jgi:hypothetical protein
LHGEPIDPTTQGYVVRCCVHDEGGEPVHGDGFWVASYGEAVVHARKIRQHILDERRAHVGGQQLTFDDALGAW